MIVSFNFFKVRFMRQMTTEKLFDEGRYMVIYLYPEVSDRMVGAVGLWMMIDRSKLILAVGET